jgi:glucose/arabinose dehydrogenase
VPFDLTVVGEGFSQPLFLTAPAGDPRLFVVEQTGAIRIIADGAVVPEPFLDVSEIISCCGERGLLGLAFHPDYASNGRFFINYTDGGGDTQVVGYTVSGDPSVADPNSASPMFSVEQPYRNHNGGWIGFGPDGLLYVGMGDGGSGGDPQGNGQNPDALLGKILRLDVDAGGAPEIFASGVRNPWRNAFDGNDFYIADVGQGVWEEINVVPIDYVGANLGWNVMEGPDCFGGGSCEQEGFVPPVHSYRHGPGCSVTGGYVYRASAIPAIEGHYFFADYCDGILQSLRYTADAGVTDVTSYADTFGKVGSVTSFGLDGQGELYLIVKEGRVLKFVARQ